LDLAESGAVEVEVEDLQLSLAAQEGTSFRVARRERDEVGGGGLFDIEREPLLQDAHCIHKCAAILVVNFEADGDVKSLLADSFIDHRCSAYQV